METYPFLCHNCNQLTYTPATKYKFVNEVNVSKHKLKQVFFYCPVLSEEDKFKKENVVVLIHTYVLQTKD